MVERRHCALWNPLGRASRFERWALFFFKFQKTFNRVHIKCSDLNYFCRDERQVIYHGISDLRCLSGSTLAALRCLHQRYNGFHWSAGWAPGAHCHQICHANLQKCKKCALQILMLIVNCHFHPSSELSLSVVIALGSNRDMVVLMQRLDNVSYICHLPRSFSHKQTKHYIMLMSFWNGKLSNNEIVDFPIVSLSTCQIVSVWQIGAISSGDVYVIGVPLDRASQDRGAVQLRCILYEPIQLMTMTMTYWMTIPRIGRCFSHNYWCFFRPARKIRPIAFRRISTSTQLHAYVRSNFSTHSALVLNTEEDMQ